jgi:ATP phosphoribosyltransferase regulatory subunit
MNIPEGLNDLLPEEVLMRRSIENKISQVFKEWGYQEIITPTFEFYEILAKGTGSIMKKEMIKFFDREGNIIALRPEMTTPIARVASTKLKGEPKPLRFYYISKVFRCDDLKMGKRKEFNQAGAELIGVNSKEADAEAIALAVECLRNSGIKNFFIDISHINFFNGIMQSIKVKKERKQEKMINNKLSLSALKEIKKIYNLLKNYGLEEYILIDLGIILDFDYYTGIIFEGYTDYLGFPICGGGRYDNLCLKFGRDLPSTGFAIGLERLTIILEKENMDSLKLERPDKYLVYYQNDKTYFKKALEVAGNLRKKGLVVELEVGKREFGCQSIK